MRNEWEGKKQNRRRPECNLLPFSGSQSHERRSVDLGSRHALIGYEEAAPYCIEANIAEEFQREILGFFASDHGEQWKDACRMRFEQLYTMDRSAKDFEQAVNV